MEIQVPETPELVQRLVLRTHQIIEVRLSPSLRLSSLSFSSNYLVVFQFVEGNITEQSVDALVSAANGDLKHEGGIAKAIADAAGPELVQDSLRFVSRSALPQGQAAFTKPGYLASRGVKLFTPLDHGGLAATTLRNEFCSRLSRTPCFSPTRRTARQ